MLPHADAKGVTTVAPRSRAATTVDTRRRILDAATELFAERGYRATSVRDIASRAELTHRGVSLHFPAKDQILIAVLARIEATTAALLGPLVSDAASMSAVVGAIARQNASIPGYFALFAAVTGEASTAGHPAHSAMKIRYEKLRTSATAALMARERSSSGVDPDAIRGHAVRLLALWDGLQLLSQFLPHDVDIVAVLEHYEEVDTATADVPTVRLDVARGGTVSSSPMTENTSGGTPRAGYEVGRRTYARIVEVATELFAQRGFLDSSLREIAVRAGTSKATLLHHFGSKDALLLAVLASHDAAVDMKLAAHDTIRPADMIRSIVQEMRRLTSEEPGLIELHAVLSCEAVPPDHAAHEYFSQRFHTSLSRLTAVIADAQKDGDVSPCRDAAYEALVLLALRDGLQYQWLYDRGGVDPAGQLSDHVEELLET